MTVTFQLDFMAFPGVILVIFTTFFTVEKPYITKSLGKNKKKKSEAVFAVFAAINTMNQCVKFRVPGESPNSSEFPRGRINFRRRSTLFRLCIENQYKPQAGNFDGTLDQRFL